MTVSTRSNNIIHDDVVSVSGSDYVTDWFETEDVRTVIVDVVGPVNAFTIDQSVDASQILNPANDIGGGEYLLSTRYIRLNVDVNGSGTLQVSMKVGSRV